MFRWIISLIPFLLLWGGVACSDVKQDMELQGVFEADEIMVAAHSSGVIQNFHLREGDQVEAHQPLGLIDTTFLSYQAQALSEQRTTTNDAGVTSLSVQTDALKEQINALEQEYLRFLPLVEKKVVPKRKLDEIETQLKVARSQFNAMKSSISRQNRSTEWTSSQLSIQQEQVRELIKRSIVSSPISGTVLSVYLHESEFAGQGRPIFKVADMKKMRLRAYATGAQLADIHVGSRVTIYPYVGEKGVKGCGGKVTWISDQAEFTPKNIHTADERASLVYAVQISVEGENHFRLGQYGYAVLDRGENLGK